MILVLPKRTWQLFALLTYPTVPFGYCTVRFSVIATIATLKLTRSEYTLKNPKNAKNTST